MVDVLTSRALNRATLQRQLLLERSTLPPVQAVEHLVGLQAQVPRDPYVALWSRLAGFDPNDLSQLVVDRKVVRIAAMRSTIHLLTADDCLVLRPLSQPVMDRELANHRDHRPHLDGVELAPVLAFARSLLAEAPRTGPQLRAALGQEFPDLDAASLAFACRNHLALVQVPPRGLWGRSSQVTVTTAEAWLGRPTITDPPVDEVAWRYFGAFGPATVADLAAWSGLTGMREVVDRLSPRLRSFRDERGRELFDQPGAPRPDPELQAPVRFLPEYDNALLSHADRSRFAPSEDVAVRQFASPRKVHGSVLHDGVLRGTWRVVDGTTLVVDHRQPLTKRVRESIAAEGRRLMRLLEPGVDAEVRFEPLD